MLIWTWGSPRFPHLKASGPSAGARPLNERPLGRSVLRPVPRFSASPLHTLGRASLGLLSCLSIQ